MASWTLHSIKEFFNLPPKRDKKAHAKQQPRKTLCILASLGSLVHTQMLTVAIRGVCYIRLKMEELMRTNKVSL